jgi:hypothetical protein
MGDFITQQGMAYTHFVSFNLLINNDIIILL